MECFKKVNFGKRAKISSKSTEQNFLRFNVTFYGIIGRYLGSLIIAIRTSKLELFSTTVT